ncbi:receptor-type tyrosine-protein phosphatase V-like isoform X4 [Erinaceus europaeus]|uniref:protein-tyrosine-phosphatase n=1 Tax=Erinaceus europaeus TaxID=9365 RepID=A0ABM3WD77_ERIEU|nr:receptor-type tyrosine-protein phosphatase V-like isoform X4 [Erinaceus europaeus]
MRPLLLFPALLWFQGFLAKGQDCPLLAESQGGDQGGYPLKVNVSNQRDPTSLLLSWVPPELGRAEYTLQLTSLSSLGSPDGQQLWAHTNTTSFEFRDLMPGSRYWLEVTALLPCGQNTTVSLTAHTAPAAVRGLQLRSPETPGSLEAEWSAAPGEQDGYQLLLHHLESPTHPAQNISVAPATLAYNFSGLVPGSEYELEVFTWAGGLRAWSSVRQWTAPKCPDRLVLRSLGTSSLQASWSSSKGAAWLHLALTDLLNGANLTAVVRRGISNHTFHHLSPGTPYQLALSAAAGPHWAAGPNATEWTYPSAPLDLALTSQPPELQAGWKAGPGARDGYLLRLLGPGQVKQNATLGPGVLSAAFPGPLPPGNYTLKLGVLAGPHKAWAQASTLLPGPLPPQLLQVTSRGSPSDLTVGWAQPLGELDGYRVTWHQEGVPRAPDSLIDLGPGDSSLTLRDLEPGSCYTVSVWSCVGNVSSSASSTRACTLPAPPANLSLSLASRPPALRASWSTPPGGRDGFLLQLYRLRPLALESEQQLSPEAHSFSWAVSAPGMEFLARLSTLHGPDESSCTNATGWTPPLAPPLVAVSSEGPTQLRASWRHAPGGRTGYQVTLMQAGTLEATSTLGPEADGLSFPALTPGTPYDVEVASEAGLLRNATRTSGWTAPLTPSELLVAMQAGSALISLAWAPGPLGQGTCHAQLLGARPPSPAQPLALGQARLVLGGLTPGRNLSLSVLCRAGPLQASTRPVVLPVEPGPVEDVQCHPEATRLVLNWTVPAGDVATCLVAAEQLVEGRGAELVFRANTTRAALLLPGLAPATSYRLGLAVLGSNGLWSRVVTLVCTTSALAWRPPELAAPPQLEPGNGPGVMISRGMFGEDNGQVQWYGVIATTNMSLTRPTQESINHTWYDHYYRGCDSYLAILLPNPFYPGPWAVPRSWMVPLGMEDCSQTQEICNGQLKPGIQYRFSIVAFARPSSHETMVSFSAFSEPRVGTSRAAMPLPAVVGIVVGTFLTICIVMSLLCWRRVKGQRAEKNRFSQELTVYNLRRTYRPIPAQGFRQSYEAKSAHAHQAFFQEFEELKEVGREQPRLEAEHPTNTSKNRYPHVLPYDHSRVRLAQLEGEPHSDYINANFIPGYTHPQEFIATQGPLKKTLEDFWRLVWEQQVQLIVMLTVGMENGRVLCEHYWPADPSPAIYGHITIHLLAEESQDEWTNREFHLQHAAQQQQRRVRQLQFTTWPDHSVPETPSSLLAFMELVRRQAREVQGAAPILVHCSAGVGRTGTFVALWRLLQQLEEEQAVDVFNAVYALRLHRPLMIQTPSQYIFLHSCLLTKILEGHPGAPEAEEKLGGESWATPPAVSPLSPLPRSQPISVSNFAQACALRAADANAGFLREYELLLQAIKDEAGSSASPPGCEQNGMVPGENLWTGAGSQGQRAGGRVASLSMCPSDDGSLARSSVEEDSADPLPEAWLFPGGFSGRDHVVLTGPAGPEELWELVWEHGAHVLVSLCPPDPKEKAFWQLETQPFVTDLVTVSWVAESSAAGWPCTLFRVTHRESGKQRQVQQLQFPSWEPGCELPAATLLPFLAAVGRCCSQDKKKPGTLLSHASKGVAQLGIFLAMDQLLQQAGAECAVDVFNVALQQSQACRLMTPTLEQYIYLYNCLNRALGDGLP